MASILSKLPKLPGTERDNKARLTDAFRRAGWIPASKDALNKWVDGKVAQGRRSRAALHPPIQELKEMIENDGDMYMGFNSMLEGGTVVKDYNEMLTTMNQIMTEAPFYGEIGPPLLMLLMEGMNTNAGLTALLAEKLNIQFKKIFDYWTKFLSTSESTYVLNSDEGGWFSSAALGAMTVAYQDSAGQPMSFEQIFKCDPTKPAWGYTSWDDFFTRELNPGVRPLEGPGEPRVISAACESSMYSVASSVQETDKFWIKGQPYSLRHMLNNDPDYLQDLVGGTVFQGFLQVTGYHRWHAPVGGIVKKIVTVPGTYYAQSPALIGEPDDEYPYIQSLGFITAITTRQLIFIDSDAPGVGVMCFIAIGMAEVSTCEATVSVGQRVERGEQLGMFHFGGSSHCLVFGPKANVSWDGNFTTPGDEVRVRGAIGVVNA